jgi:hypothetical protein
VGPPATPKEIAVRSSRPLPSPPPFVAASRFAVAALLLSLMVALPAPSARAHGTQGAPRVLRVGTWHGIPGPYADIQSAVDAARPGDWILIGPGDYHEQGDRVHPRSGDAGGGVFVTTSRLHLRGMDRNEVVIDGTRAGASRCSSAPGDQDFGPLDAWGAPVGRNGVLVFEADGVSVENLTACNFLDGAYGGGNQIWWNGGDGTGTIGMGPYFGAYLSATSTFFQPGAPQGEYGIFVSNARGPGSIVHTYASNMADSSYYIGACPDCNAWLLDAHAQNSALGYSGTNSGGHLVVGYSEWDHNKTGISTNSQNNDDAPSPQDGACPLDRKGLFGTRSCTYFIGNRIHDNNNPNVPGSGSADLGPVGTGMVVSGGRHDTIAWNRVEDNGSWGILLVPFPDTGTPPPIANCAGGVPNPGGVLGALGVTCYFNDFGNEVRGNFLRGNGAFGNDTNGDLADISDPTDDANCWHGNFDPNGVTTAPPDLQTTNGKCGVPGQGADLTSDLAQEVICATQAFGPCAGLPGEPGYPQRTNVALMPLPRERSMRDPCAGVPRNPWCPGHRF